MNAARRASEVLHGEPPAMAVADWVYLTDTATGCSYYANLQTRETSWHRPAELDDPAAVPADGSASDGGCRARVEARQRSRPS